MTEEQNPTLRADLAEHRDEMDPKFVTVAEPNLEAEIELGDGTVVALGDATAAQIAAGAEPVVENEDVANVLANIRIHVAPTVSELLTYRRDELSQEFIDDTEPRLEEPVVLHDGSTVPLGDATLDQIEEDSELFGEAENAQGEAKKAVDRVLAAREKGDPAEIEDAERDVELKQVAAWEAQIKVTLDEAELKENQQQLADWKARVAMRES